MTYRYSRGNVGDDEVTRLVNPGNKECSSNERLSIK